MVIMNLEEFHPVIPPRIEAAQHGHIIIVVQDHLIHINIIDKFLHGIELYSLTLVFIHSRTLCKFRLSFKQTHRIPTT